MAGDRPSFFSDLKLFFVRLGSHWRELRLGDLITVAVTVGFGVLAVYMAWWAALWSVLGFWAMAAVVAFRVWGAEQAALLKAREDLLDAEARMALRARLDVLYGLLEEGWRLEPLVLHLPTKSGWKAERLRGVLDRVCRPVLEWQSRVRKELEDSGLGAVSQWDGAANGVTGGSSSGGAPLEDTEEAILLREVVKIRTGYFRRVPLLKNMVMSARS